MKRSSTIYGAAIGGILAVPLTVIFYLAEQLFGLPFVPFNIFDWMARVLPGDIVRFGIDTMVKFITTLNIGDSTSSTAKSLEHIMAILGLWVTCIVAGGVFFFIMHERETQTGTVAGLILGVIVGVPVALISVSVSPTGVISPVVEAVWVVAVFAVWGFAVGRVWMYDRASQTATEEAEVQRMDRRSFLVRIGGLSAVITVVGAGLGALLENREESTAQTISESDATPQPVQLPNADDPFIPAPGTRPEYTPLDEHYRIDIRSRPLELDVSEWKLTIDGMVDTPLELSLDDLRNNYEPRHQFVTLSCISNPVGGDLISTTRWTGASVRDVLAGAGVQKGDVPLYLNIQSADGFHESLELAMVEEDERIMFTYAWDAEPLRDKHGSPLRIYIPDRYGMKQPKWIESVTISDEKEVGFWVDRRWDPVARVKATSVVDTVAVDELVEQEDGQTLVPIGGIAFAGARSISKVEVKVDDDEWVEAQLRSPLSDKTWVIWRYDWPFEEGEHRFAVRCVDGESDPQIEESQDTFPSGATGIHSVSETLE